MTLDIWYASFHISCSVRVSCLFYSFEKGCTVCLLHRIGPTVKNPPETRLEKFVKLTDHTFAYKDLINFGYAAHAMTGNGNNVNLQKFACKNLWNHFGGTYFRRVLAIRNHCAAACCLWEAIHSDIVGVRQAKRTPWFKQDHTLLQ